ncbi:MAG: ABC transporter permease, partial [Acidobacteriota bacterium]|nr:ABC transporter permease [Acidobacteriota bacterium]
MKRFRRRIHYLLNHKARYGSLQEEMEFHIASMVADLTAQGISETEARAAARRKFGNMTQQAEEAQFTWISRWMNDLAQDLRLTFRGMRRDAAFTTFVILIAGLGIGASSVVFSVVNALLLRPLPFRNPGELVWIFNDGGNGEEYTTQVDHLLDLKARNRSFVDMAGYFGFYRKGDRQLTGTGEPERLTAIPVTQNFFPMLGVDPLMGRAFAPEECNGRTDAPPAVMLSYGFWRRRFASDRSIVGRKLSIGNRPTTVIGVLPATFDFASVFDPGMSVDIFLPAPLTEQVSRQGNTTKIVARLRPGVTISTAQAEFRLLGSQLEKQHPERNGIAPILIPLRQHVSGRIRPALIVLICAVAAVMLIVCANLSNLLLARMAARQKELAMRVALGAGRLRLLRKTFTESAALSCCGAAFGLALAVAGTRAIAHLTSFNLPLLTTVRVDADAVLFTLLATLVTGILFGALPALQVPALAVQDAL